MLTRIADARVTKSIDLPYKECSLERALEELKRLASAGLGDYMRFMFAPVDPTEAEDKYRSGLRVVF